MTFSNTTHIIHPPVYGAIIIRAVNFCRADWWCGAAIGKQNRTQRNPVLFLILFHQTSSPSASQPPTAVTQYNIIYIIYFCSPVSKTFRIVYGIFPLRKISIFRVGEVYSFCSNPPLPLPPPSSIPLIR